MAKLPKDPRDHYIATKLSLAKIAELYEIPLPTIKRRCKRENWTDLRSQKEAKVIPKTVEKIAEHQASQAVDRVTQVNTEYDELATFFIQLVKGKANDYIETDEETGKKRVSASVGELKTLFGAARTAQLIHCQALGMTGKNLELSQFKPFTGASDEDILEKLNETAESVWEDEDGG